jgi:hypothetical protein
MCHSEVLPYATILYGIMLFQEVKPSIIGSQTFFGIFEAEK